MTDATPLLHQRNGHHARPRVAFVGLGWIGLKRLQSIAQSGQVEIAALLDERREAAAAAALIAPRASVISSYDEILSDSIDGVVIATPNALHTSQTVAALQNGIAVFCQKPLGCNLAETWASICAARENNCLLGLDLSYRFIPGMQQIRQLVQSGSLGRIFSVDLKFHNGYGPDKSWFYQRSMSGGGCVLDLGVHLIDLALWTLNFPRIAHVCSSLFSHGELIGKQTAEVEDYAVAGIRTIDNVAVNLTCSWNLHVGADAEIEVRFYGTEGAGVLRNVSGSFFEFVAEHHRGSHRQVIYQSNAEPADWSGLAALDWCQQLVSGGAFADKTDEFLHSAAVIDRIYAADD